MTASMLVDESYWDGASVHSNAEMYPETATSTEDRFVNFILNELARELKSGNGILREFTSLGLAGRPHHIP